MENTEELIKAENKENLDKDGTIEPAPTSQGEKQKEFHSEIPVKELTEVKLEELFFERQVLLYSDGQLYVRIYNHLETVNRSELEALVYSVLRNEFRRIGKRSKIRAVADLIKLKMPFEFPWIDYSRRLVAFKNYILDIDSLFSPYRSTSGDICASYPNCMYELPFSILPNYFENTFPFGPNPDQYSSESRTKQLPTYFKSYNLPFPDAISIYNMHRSAYTTTRDLSNNPILNYTNEAEFQYRLIKEINNIDTSVADKFFMDIADGDLSIVERIYQMIGYILIPGNEAKAYFLLQGESDSGKSVLGKFLEGYFPPELVTSLDISRLGEKYLPEELSTSCLNLSMDLPNGKMSAKSAAVLKMLTGDDLITHEVKYKNAKPYRGRCKFVFSTNFPLEMTVYDEAFLNRTVCIPFKKSIPKDKQDSQLLSKLNAERENITIKAIALYYFLRKNNFKFSGADKIKPKVNYRMDVNEAIRSFIETKCSITYNSDDFVSTKELYDAFLVFCNDSGITYNSNINSFSQRVRNLYYPHIEPHRTHENGDFIRGYSKIKVYTNPLVFIK